MTAANPVKRMLFLSVGVLSAFIFFWPPDLTAQVNPAEIKNPRLKTLEQTYLPNLTALNQAVSEMQFPLKLSLNRHVGLDPKDQIDADRRGLEFVIFHEREILKITANYNAAFDAGALTPNQRAARVLDEVILPILRLLPRHFNQNDPFDGFGFEIGYHVRKHNRSYEYEGKENLVVVFDKPDGLRYPVSEDAEQQKILNHSEIYLNGEPFGLALKSNTPFEVDTLARRFPEKSSSTADIQSTSAKTPVPTPATKATIDALREKYQVELESLSREGAAKFHFVDYAPPSFIIVHDQAALQATLHNPESFDRDAGSIYRRAARSFDLFLAPQLKWIISKTPDTPDLSILDISIVNELTSARADKSSEAIEFIFPLKDARQFAAAEITNQDLIDRSVVLVNGVRIALSLAQVE
jgi:hypothetical protein